MRPQPSIETASGPPGARLPSRRGMLVAFGLSGAAALSYEVIWTRALSVVVGSTTYAVASMLATFMFGLAVGGLLGGRLADRTSSPVFALGLCELAIGFAGVVGLVTTRALPSMYLVVYRELHLAPAAFFAVQIGLCALVMLAPTVLMGMTFPFVTRALVDRLETVGGVVGAAYGANTVGAVAGSVVAGFGLIPLLGLAGAAFATAAVNFAVGAWLVLRTAEGRRRAAPVLAASVLLYLPAALAAAAMAHSWTFVSFYSAHRYLAGPDYETIQRGDRIAYERLSVYEDADAHVAAFRGPGRELILQVNGKIEGTALRDHANATLLAYLPIAAHAAPRRMLVIGLGSGVTLGAAKRAVPEVDLVEISAGVLEANRRHAAPGLLEGVRVARNDARNFLLLEEGSYDVISSEPSYPTDFAVGNLFTREYFQLASRRLAPGGVYCQWLPYYLLTNDDVTLMVKTFASVFPHVTVWKVPESLDLLVLGSHAPFAREPAEVERQVAALNGGERLAVVLSRTPEEVARIASLPGVPINTDDAPIFEFRVARNLRVGDLALVEQMTEVNP